MEISTIAIIAVVAFLVISITCTAIKHFIAKKSETPELPRYDEIVIPEDSLKEFEPIKSHIIELRKAERIRDAIHRAIENNLRNNGCILEPKYPWMQKYNYSYELPDIIELQNIISIKPIIKEIEDQYKRFEEARDTAYAEVNFTTNLIKRVMSKLRESVELKNLVSEKFRNKPRSSDIYEILLSPEAKGIVERCINEVVSSVK